MNADQGLNIPDLRSAERTFQLVTQVVGRSGRGIAGQALIQTYNPDHYSILKASEQDYNSFFEREMQFREDANYPPFCKLTLLELSGNHEQKVKLCATKLYHQLENTLNMNSESFPSVEMLGPSPAVISKIKNKYRFHIMVKSKQYQEMNQLIRLIQKHYPKGQIDTGVNYTIDIDPLNML